MLYQPGSWWMITMPTSLQLNKGIKAESHCSNNANDNDNDAKRTQSIGLIAPRRIRPGLFNQSRACILIVLVFVLVIGACVTGP